MSLEESSGAQVLRYGLQALKHWRNQVLPSKRNAWKGKKGVKCYLSGCFYVGRGVNFFWNPMHSSENEMPLGRQESESVCGLFVSFSLSLSHQMPSLSRTEINKRAQTQQSSPNKSIDVPCHRYSQLNRFRHPIPSHSHLNPHPQSHLSASPLRNILSVPSHSPSHNCQFRILNGSMYCVPFMDRYVCLFWGCPINGIVGLPLFFFFMTGESRIDCSYWNPPLRVKQRFSYRLLSTSLMCAWVCLA